MEPVRYARDGAVARITLARPTAGNTLDVATARALVAAVDAANADRAAVVVLQAEGRFFCAGGDLGDFAGAPDRGGRVSEVATHAHRAVLGLVRSDAVVVAAVQGAAAGIGVPLVAAADLVVAARSASFTLAYTAIGLSPDGGTTALLAATLGVHRLLRLALLNPRLTAQEAHELGLVAEVVDDAELPGTVDALAARLAAGPAQALAATKHLVRGPALAALETQLAAEQASIARLVGTPDGREGVDAFLAKRPPTFGS